MRPHIKNKIQKVFDIILLYLFFCICLAPAFNTDRSIITLIVYIFYPIIICQIAMFMFYVNMIANLYGLRLTCLTVFGFICSAVIVHLATIIQLRGLFWPFGIIVPIIAGIRLWNYFEKRSYKISVRILTGLFLLFLYLGFPTFGWDFI